MMCSSYIVLFLAEVCSKRFTYYYPWQTSYLHKLLNTLGSIPASTRFKAPQAIQINCHSYRQVLVYGRVN